MATFWAIRKGDALWPDGAESAAEFSKIPFSKPILVKATKPRNSRHAALYWVLCHRIANAVGADPENISDLLKIETGHCDILHSKKYGEIRLPKSISFAAMDQTQFSEFFEKCVQAIYTNWGIARQDVLDAVADLLEPKTEQIGA